MNVNYLASSALQATYSVIPVQWYAYSGQTNTLGTLAVTYASPVTLNANVQLMTRQQLRHIEGYNQTKIYKNFWINNDQLTGLNRNISTGGDYLTYDNLTYKIIGVENNYSTDWILVNAVESDVQ